MSRAAASFALIALIALVAPLASAGCGERSEDVVARVGRADGGAAGGPLDLELWDPGALDNELRFAVRITNWGSAPVALGRLAVKVWFDHGGGAALEARSDDEALSVYDKAGAWRRNLAPTRVAFAGLTPPEDCGGGRRASRVATVSFAAADTAAALEPGGGYVACNHDTNAMATWHRTDWAKLDLSGDYSQIADAGASAAARSDLRQFTLYLDGQLVTERGEAGPDPQTGVEPCP